MDNNTRNHFRNGQLHLTPNQERITFPSSSNPLHYLLSRDKTLIHIDGLFSISTSVLAQDKSRDEDTLLNADPTKDSLSLSVVNLEQKKKEVRDEYLDAQKKYKKIHTL
jgi:hypothetical protein